MVIARARNESKITADVKEVKKTLVVIRVPSEAFRKYRLARKLLLEELDRSDSNRDPLSELSEIIASAKLGAKRVDNRVQKGYDLIGPDGEHIEVKYVANPIENGRIVWKNWHEVRFDKEERDKYALVVYVDLNPTAMFVFSKGQIQEVCKRLGKRHRNQEWMLEFVQSDYKKLLEHKEQFRELGVQVFEHLV